MSETDPQPAFASTASEQPCLTDSTATLPAREDAAMTDAPAEEADPEATSSSPIALRTTASQPIQSTNLPPQQQQQQIAQTQFQRRITPIPPPVIPGMSHFSSTTPTPVPVSRTETPSNNIPNKTLEANGLGNGIAPETNSSSRAVSAILTDTNTNTSQPAAAACFSLPSEAAPHGAPTRAYLNAKVTGTLLEGMRILAKERPHDPLRVLGEFLLQRSREKKSAPLHSGT